MGIGKTCPHEIWHRVGLHPNYIVQYPEPGVLKHRPHPVDIVIAADNPDAAGILQHAPALQQPRPCEVIILTERVKLIPPVVNGTDPRPVRPEEIAVQLQIIRRIGKDQVGRRVGQQLQQLQAVAMMHLVYFNCPRFHLPFFSNLPQ